MADDVETLLLRLVQDVVDGDRVVADGGLVPPEVPELGTGGAKRGVVPGVGGSPVVDHPHVVS